MKSVTIYGRRGELLLQVIHRKNGAYELNGDSLILRDLDIEVRDDQNKKVTFPKEG